MKLSLPNVSIGFWETFEYFEAYPIFTYLVGHFWDFFRKISVFGQIGSMEHFFHSILVNEFRFLFGIDQM